MSALFTVPDQCPDCGGDIDFIVENAEYNQARWQCWQCDAEWSHDGESRATTPTDGLPVPPTG